MVFAPKCVAAPRPMAYVVDTFVEGSGRFNDYPDPTRYAFAETFAKNLTQFQVTRGRTPLGGAKDFLFGFDMPPTLNDAPTILEFGDVVLGFVHLPPYVVVEDEVDSSERAKDDVHPLTAAINAVADHFEKAARARWTAVTVVGTAFPPGSDGRVSRADVGRSLAVSRLANAPLKKGGSAQTFVAWRIGLIDVAFPASAAVPEIWRAGKDQKKIIAELKALEFGPKAVDHINDEAYQRTVGRGLAYNLLHEFWHLAESKFDHPYASGNRVIENDDGTRPTEGITFQPQVVTAVEAEYQKSWCKTVSDKRLSLANIKP